MCRTWWRGISGSGEHFSLCKGAHDCKRLFYALIVKYSKYRLGVLPSILDDCINEEILIIIYCWVDLFGSFPSPLYLFAIVDVLG